MDEVLEKLEGTNISQESDENKTNFDGLYKNRGKLGNQEERRKELLEVQKTNRNSKLDKFRGIIELVNAVEYSETYKYINQTAYYRPSIYVAGFTKTSVTYNNVLMISEWMIEKPEDFYENWLAVPCPKGVRVLVVANQGRTKCYTKFGQFIKECRTALPGGNPCDPQNKNRNRCCVLDCFFDEKMNTMYILDLLAWNSQPMTDGETEFRHYWLQTNLDQIDDLKTINKKNKLIFQILPKTPCDKKSFNKFMMVLPHFPNFTPPLDGLLFYHRKAHYVAGQTPLVGWLYPYMVPEVLGTDITVNPGYMAQKPIDYVKQADFIQKFEEKLAKKVQARQKGTRAAVNRNNAMDTTPAKADNRSGVSKKNSGKRKTRTTSTQYEEMDEDGKQSQEDNKGVANGRQETQIADPNDAQVTGGTTKKTRGRNKKTGGRTKKTEYITKKTEDITDCIVVDENKAEINDHIEEINDDIEEINDDTRDITDETAEERDEEIEEEKMEN